MSSHDGINVALERFVAFLAILTSHVPHNVDDRTRCREGSEASARIRKVDEGLYLVSKFPVQKC
jgi:hypothetical protein